MNRRTFLKATAAALAAFVLPAQRHRIDLMQFCGGGANWRYDTSLPWVTEDWTYATDKRCCVRVRPESGDRFQHEGRMPPFGNLEWDHERLNGWRELRPLEPILSESWCPTCGGTGLEGDAIFRECELCGGNGTRWSGSDYDLSHPVRCRHCNGEGYRATPEANYCPMCQGTPWGVFPSVVQLDSHYFDVNLYRKVQHLGGDAVVLPDSGGSMMRFRFDGGSGLLMGMDEATIRSHIAAAKESM